LKSTGVTCPHIDAFVPDGKQEYFRVLKHLPVSSDNFLPTPVKEGQIVDSCIQKSVSLFDNMDGLINAFFKIPAHKKKQKVIGVLKLTSNDGLLKQTFAAGHHSWWRTKSFNSDAVTLRYIEV
jgi:hypothetical protein